MTRSPDALIRRLAEHDPIKVWSWLTTIFGDMAFEPGAELSGALLNALTERIGIKPEAMRVALHRLRKDGWVSARRDGRKSCYRLTETALAETRAASGRIFAPSVLVPTVWHLAIFDPGRESPPDAFETLVLQEEAVRIAPHMLLAARSFPSGPEGALIFEVDATQIPDWMIEVALPEMLNTAAHRLATLLAEVDAALENPDVLLPLDAATIRLLVLHHWRRYALKCPPLIEALAGADWTGRACRGASLRILDALPRQTADAVQA